MTCNDRTMASITFHGDPVSTVGELPAVGSTAPAFELEGLSPETCGAGGRGKGCMLVFLSGPVARTDVPGIEGGFDGKRKK